MPRQGTPSKAIGLIVGLALMVAATYAVFFVDWSTEVAPEPRPVRPLKTMVIESPTSASGRAYPGRVRANEEVQLAFQVAGQLIEFPVKRGLYVEEGGLLARLDPRDYENTLAVKQATLDAAAAEYQRIQGLAERQIAAEKEKTDSKAAYDAALADRNMAQKALEDTSLRAPFKGVVADTFVDNFQNITAKQPILSLQEIDQVEIVVDVPEERIIRAVHDTNRASDPAERAKRERERYRFVATFEYLPNREFEVELKEISTDADPATQTFAATFVMPSPTDVTILPGMTATIREFKLKPDHTEATAYAVPLDAVPIDGQGNYFVWRVQDADGGTATVHRADVRVGEMAGDDILVLDGLKPGDRIALAGVHLLEEGQRVRPLLARGAATR